MELLRVEGLEGIEKAGMQLKKFLSLKVSDLVRKQLTLECGGVDALFIDVSMAGSAKTPGLCLGPRAPQWPKQFLC